MTISLTDAERGLMLQAAPKDCRKGRVEFRVCPLCGIVSWVCTNPNALDELVVSEDFEPCSSCREVRQRAPELVDWVIRVINWALRKQKQIDGK